MDTNIFDAIVKKTNERAGGFDLHYPFLYGLVVGMEAKNVLELGAGFSTPVILNALKKTTGTLITCDQRNLEDTGNNPTMKEQYPTWTYLQGDTRQTLSTIPKSVSFDVVLHDGSHEWRVVYKDLRQILPHIKHNGILLIHDTEHIPTYRLKMAVRLALLGYHYEILTLPYGYGLTIVRILGNRHNGEVKITWTKNKK